MMKYCYSIFLSLFVLSVCGQEQQIPKEYSTLKHFNMHQDLEFPHENYSLTLTSKQIDTFGLVDASDTINFYINKLSNNNLKEISNIIILPEGTILINKCIIIPSFIHLKGMGAGLTRIKCNVGENKNCIEIRPLSTSPFAKIPLSKSILKGSDTLLLSKDRYDNLGLNDSTAILCAVVKSKDSGLITSSWAKGSVKEHFWMLKSGIKDTNYIVPIGVRDASYLNARKTDKTIGADRYGGRSAYKTYQKPLVINYDTSDYVEFYSSVLHAGVMCLSIERMDTTIGQTSNIVLTNAAYCLIRGVESKGCNFAHIELNNSFFNTIKRNLIYDGNGYGGGGRAYGILLQNGSSSNTLVDNVLHHLRHSIILQSGANTNVIQANYSYNPFWEQNSFPADAAGDIVLHGNYPFANLFEFNVAQQVVIDDSHGKNGPFNIFHRNWLQNYGITMPTSNGSDSQVFTGNEITNTTFLKGFYLLQDKGHFQFGNQVKGAVSPSSTNGVLTKMVAANNYWGQYVKRTASYIPPAVVDYFNVPFGEPFNQAPKTILALNRKDTLPNCFDYHSDYSFYGAVDGLEKASEPFAFPNPSTSLLQISLQGNLQVFDVAGKLVLNQEITENENVISLPKAGLYVLKINHKSKVDTQKVLIVF